MLALVGAYLIGVLVIGPRLMNTRKPLEIKALIRVYNISMILLNGYLLKRSVKLVDNGKSFFNCRGVELVPTQEDEIAKLTELFLVSRVLDFLDTVWFVLRKKHSHVSFLHVFHHSYVPIAAFVGTRFIPVSPNAMAFPFVNSFIHVIMYTYYFLATFPSMRAHLWWKRYLTSLQILQFISMLAYNVFGAVYFSSVCGKTQIPALIGSLVSATIFLVLFRSFYKKTYSQTSTNDAPGAQPFAKHAKAH